MYKKTINKKTQKEMWFKDGKLISVKDVPEEIKNPPRTVKTKTSDGVEITETNEDIPATKSRETPPEAPEQPKETKIDKPIISPEKPQGGCIFDGTPSEYQRSIWQDGKMNPVNLCGSCYFEKTLGEITQQLRRQK